MSEGRYAAAIFDLDGTLTRPHLIDFAAIKCAIGCPLDDTIIEFLRTLHGSELREAWKLIDRFEAEGVARALPNPDAHSTLAELAGRGIPCFVLTRNSRRAALATLHHLGMAHRITDLIGREDASPKPDPAGVLALVRRWRLPLSRTLMVGDFHFDVHTGAAAHVATALLTNGTPLDPGIRFAAGHPTHLVHGLHELLRFF